MKPRRSAPLGAGVVQQTKLIPPTKTRALIERDRLVSRAMDGARGRLLLVTAAAGYGKTSVLVQVHEKLVQQRCRVSWISFDEADNDHTRFLAHLVDALQKSSPGFGHEIAAALRAAATIPAAILRTRLLNDLAAIEHDLFVFLDDYHAIGDADVRETLAAVLLAPLPSVHLLIATRSRNDLPVGRLQTLGQMVEIEGAELAFSDLEAGRFIDNACDKRLSRSQLSRLCSQTEGWAASLQLAAIALNSVEDVTRFLDDFSGETRTVGEFLGEEVLRRQPEPLQRFLMQTSILKRFNTALACAVTGRDDSRTMLDELESRNLFIFSLDVQREWFRYHHLFADFLQRRLRDCHPGLCEALQRRAADWLMRNGFPIEAIDHAFLAADSELAGQLLDATCTQLFAAGQNSTLQKQAARLPPEMLSRLPRLQLELTWDYELRWQFPPATRALRSVREFLENEGRRDAATLTLRDKAFLESKVAHREMMLALLMDRLPEAFSLAQKWTTATPAEEPFMRASVGTTQMHANRERFRCEGTPAIAESLHHLFLEGDAHYGTVFHDSASGLTMFMRGELIAAERWYERARRTAIALQGEESQLTAMPTALLAELRYECGDLVSARDLLARHARATVDFGFTDHPIARFVTSARLAFVEGRLDDAEETLEAGLYLAGKHSLQRLGAHLLSERVRQLIANRRGRDALALTDRPPYRCWFAALEAGDEATTTQELLAIAWSRVCIAQGEPATALPLLRRWATHTRNRRCVRAMVRTSAVLAAAHVACGDVGAARRVLRAALKMCPTLGFVRSFVDESPLVVGVLQELLASMPDPVDAMGQRIHDILAAAGVMACRHEAPQPAAVDALAVLTERELEIVTLTAQGMATADISSALGLTDSTVKWYWQRIFAKLQVHRRFAVVKLARGRGWIT